MQWNVNIITGVISHSPIAVMVVMIVQFVVIMMRVHVFAVSTVQMFRRCRFDFGHLPIMSLDTYHRQGDAAVLLLQHHCVHSCIRWSVVEATGCHQPRENPQQNVQFNGKGFTVYSNCVSTVSNYDMANECFAGYMLLEQIPETNTNTEAQSLVSKQKNGFTHNRQILIL